MKKTYLSLAGVSLLLLSACSKNWSDKDNYNPFEGRSAESLYKEANQKMAQKEYESAAKRYEALESMYPFNDHAEQAELNLIYSYYQKQDYVSAAATAERFIHLYPRAKHVDYAYYMKGLANFQQPRGTLTRLLPIDESWRNPGTQVQAYSDFATLVQNFPASRYRANALQRMIYLRNMFAQFELNLANYYYERRMYVAAAGRASKLIKNYPQAKAVRAAMVVLYRSRLNMGLKAGAEEVQRVYEATYHKKP